MGLLKCTGSSYYNNPIYADIQGMSRVFIHLVVGRLCPFRLNQDILSRLSLDIDRKNPLKMYLSKRVFLLVGNIMRYLLLLSLKHKEFPYSLMFMTL